jgi:lipopolysaccharide transport system permease protein
MMLYYGFLPSIGLLAVFLILLLLLLAALGVGTFLAALNVYYRDFKYVIPFLVQIWMFATPSVYMQPKEDAGGLAETIMALNPINPLIAAFRGTLLTQPISHGVVTLAGALAGLAFLVGCLYFRRVEDEFADFI